jgi:hypothetical protein
MVSDTPAVGLNRLYDSGLHIINPGRPHPIGGLCGVCPPLWSHKLRPRALPAP